jgi:thiosulfate dehydrogenase
MQKNRIKKFIIITTVLVFIAVMLTLLLNRNDDKKHSITAQPLFPDTSELLHDSIGNLIRYGRQLIINTSTYLGPYGTVAHHIHGANCQNCHLNAGTKPFGNNFLMVACSYPKFKERSGMNETIVKKVNDCFERSMNGIAIDSNSIEMKAMVAYIKWIGKYTDKHKMPGGCGIEELPLLNRAADTAKGRIVYITKCAVCHGLNGRGTLNTAQSAFMYPSLWGNDSYNIGASIFRLSKFAGFVKNNMPFGATHATPQLSNEQAWDVAAFVNSQPHAFKNIKADWPKLSTKPFDYPFGPFADTLFTAEQHKYGPFAPIKNAMQQQ